MSKVVIQVVDFGVKYVCKLAKPFPIGGSVWSFAESAELAWRFDSLEEAERIWECEYPNHSHEEGLYISKSVTFFEVNT